MNDVNIFYGGVLCAEPRCIVFFLYCFFFILSITMYARNKQDLLSSYSQLPRVVSEKCYIKEIGPNDKYLLHLEGTPWEIGYSIGRMKAGDICKLASSEYSMAVMSELTRGKYDFLFKRKWVGDLMQSFARHQVKKLVKSIPEEYLEEMVAITAGVNDELPQARLNVYDVMVLNVGMDTIFSWLYRTNMMNAHGCQGFVVHGEATIDGCTYMGRHFMYPGHIIKDTMLLAEYAPERGYPFVSVTAPGFVGVLTGMNAKGVGIGMDVLPTREVNRKKLGMGALLEARQVMEKAASMEEAIELLKDYQRGVSWAFLVGDGNGNGAVIECTAERFIVRRDTSVYPEQLEEEETVVTVANHAIAPEISAIMIDKSPLRFEETDWRYAELTYEVLQAHGQIDEVKARELINILSPGPESWFYGEDLAQPVQVSVTIMDLTNKRLWSLYGRYDHTWVSFDFSNRI